MNATLVSRDATSVGGEPAVALTYRAVQSGAAVEHRNVVVIHAGHKYVIGIGAAEGGFGPDLASFAALLASWSWR